MDRHCSVCKEDMPEDHFYWMKDQRYKAGGKWRCRDRKKKNDKASRDRLRDSGLAKPRKIDPVYARYKSYVYIDKQKGRTETVKWIDAKIIMLSACHYCLVVPAGGLDRKESSEGHTQENVVPCCMQCNMILGDLPYVIKEMLQDGLRKARAEGHLGLWIPPQLRTNGRTKQEG